MFCTDLLIPVLQGCSPRRELQAQEIKSKAGAAVFCAVLGVIVLGVAVFFITKAVTQNRIDKATQGLDY